MEEGEGAVNVGEAAGVPGLKTGGSIALIPSSMAAPLKAGVEARVDFNPKRKKAPTGRSTLLCVRILQERSQRS